MSRLVIPKIECVESGDDFGRFRAEPLEKGFGITLGNAMRRALLSYLPGAAVTRVKIEGIQHEFTIIPHAKEDAMEFLLNVKALRLKSLADRPGKLILDVQGEGRVCAADIKPSTDFEIVNSELCLASLDSPEAKLYVEFDVELGEGYRLAEASDSLPAGVIPLDAIFTPIRKVNFTIEPIHIGRETSHERLFLEVWTDGTMSPTDAISLGAGILIEQLSPFVEYVKISQLKAEEQLIRLSIPDEKYNMPVEQLDLSVRTMNCLRRSGITTVGELISKKPKELLKLRNFGQKSHQEIEERLERIGLSLAPQVELKKREETDQIEDQADSTTAETSTEVESPEESEEQTGEPAT
ncbi:MAG TPA: DNA-directed RNA polymerase subunit alpha [Dehalococcoidales bacterium]|nr:DNA-directed RNA polymerase subunit alpha [Dehalococcoidales bacterium]